NPANDRIVLQFNSDRTQESWVTLYDMQGRAVRTTAPVTVSAGEGVVNMNIADLTDGMYIARLNMGNQFATKKVVVKH
ncbi:MAG: T9SS type A sorting domain-containing protein, partial [Bacteroidota bacterium]